MYKFSTRFDGAAALWENGYFCAEVGGGMADWQRDLSSRNGCFNTVGSDKTSDPGQAVLEGWSVHLVSLPHKVSP